MMRTAGGNIAGNGCLEYTGALMKYDYYDLDEPAAALATPWGESALAVIRAAGVNTIDLLSACFSRPDALRAAASHSIVHGHITTLADGEYIDEVTVAVFRKPHGYTGDDSAEIFCHGSLAGIQMILDALKQAGFRDARPGEFTLRAFMNGKLDLTQAEAVQEIVSAKSGKAHHLALNRLSGGLSKLLLDMKEELVDILSLVEVQLDYAEDEVELPVSLPIDQLSGIGRRLGDLAGTYSTGRMYSEGARIALAGPTNAGKSSLFNLFLKEDRSIVSEIHGTTRDYIESWITIEGLPVRLYDTAGFRASNDSIEAEGIRRSSQLLEHADLVLYINGSKDDPVIFDQEERGIYIWNKSDIRSGEVPAGYLPLSTVTTEGFAELEQEILRRLKRSSSGEHEQKLMIDSLRQKELVERAASSLEAACGASDEQMPLDIIAGELQDALDALGELNGEVTSTDILDRIFSGFCVGK
jgi:tRNA modification GTPase